MLHWMRPWPYLSRGAWHPERTSESPVQALASFLLYLVPRFAFGLDWRTEDLLLPAILWLSVRLVSIAVLEHGFLPHGVCPQVAKILDHY